jgi:hypothetical protein
MPRLDWKSVVRTVAPTVATALGGPLAGVATRALGDKLLGRPEAGEEEIARAVLAAGPEELAKLRQAEYEFAARMAELDIEVERVAAADRASARQRQIATKDRMPAVIAAFATFGFFGLLALIAFVELPQTSEAPLNVMLGALGALISQIGQFYFGSSSDSRKKTTLMAEHMEAVTPMTRGMPFPNSKPGRVERGSPEYQ